jgi:hypothetical protein
MEPHGASRNGTGTYARNLASHPFDPTPKSESKQLLEVAQGAICSEKYVVSENAAMTDKARLISEFELFRGNGGGIEGWFSDAMPQTVVEVLFDCESRPISCEVLNQLLILSHEGGMSRDFFDYYFLYNPHIDGHSWYDPARLPEFEERFIGAQQLLSLNHLKWGLRRLYTDGLLYFGNIRQAYRSLRTKDKSEIITRLNRHRFDTKAMINRGSGLPLEQIARDDRYLIAEMACKTYDPADPTVPPVKLFVRDRYKQQFAAGKKPTLRDLVTSVPDEAKFTSDQLSLSLDEVLDQEIGSEEEIDAAIEPIVLKFKEVRERALRNTKLYLSMIADLDIYVATSMRKRDDFRTMAEFCDAVFRDPKLSDLKLRYFDPTRSAALGHEDKGLIECLMVKCAKVLVYNAGTSDSFGKDVEAAMALSLGKPVIFFCDVDTRRKIYRDVHPLTRLIDFESGVAVGAIVTENRLHVIELVSRIFRNEMELDLSKKKGNYFLLTERLTGSTIRLQTDDLLLRETFWNYYHT